MIPRLPSSSGALAGRPSGRPRSERNSRCSRPAKLDHTGSGVAIAARRLRRVAMSAAGRTAHAELFFCRNIEGRQPLTDAEWGEFAAQIIAPNFPDGFPAFDGEGQWRNPQTGQIAGGLDQNPARRSHAGTRSSAPSVGGDRGLQDAVTPASVGIMTAILVRRSRLDLALTLNRTFPLYRSR